MVAGEMFLMSEPLQRIFLSLLGFVAGREMREQVCLTVATTSFSEHIYAEVSQTLSEQIEEPASPANAVVPFLQVVCQTLSGALDTAYAFFRRLLAALLELRLRSALGLRAVYDRM